MTASYIIS